MKKVLLISACAYGTYSPPVAAPFPPGGHPRPRKDQSRTKRSPTADRNDPRRKKLQTTPGRFAKPFFFVQLSAMYRSDRCLPQGRSTKMRSLPPDPLLPRFLPRIQTATEYGAFSCRNCRKTPVENGKILFACVLTMASNCGKIEPLNVG